MMEKLEPIISPSPALSMTDPLTPPRTHSPCTSSPAANEANGAESCASTNPSSPSTPHLTEATNVEENATGSEPAKSPPHTSTHSISTSTSSSTSTIVLSSPPSSSPAPLPPNIPVISLAHSKPPLPPIPMHAAQLTALHPIPTVPHGPGELRLAQLAALSGGPTATVPPPRALLPHQYLPGHPLLNR